MPPPPSPTDSNSDPRDYRLELSSLSGAAGENPSGQAGTNDNERNGASPTDDRARPFLSVHFRCCNAYARILAELANAMKPVILPGETLNLKVVREGKDKGQGVGYLPDGTMVVVNNGQASVGQQVEVQVQSQLQTGAGVIVFADLKRALAA